MERPIDVDLPHKLGKAEARRRLATNIGSLERHIPGGARVENSWTGDTLNLTVNAMGQTIEAKIDVEETKVHCRVMLPGMLALFAAPIEAMLQRKGSDLLLEDKRD
ncbi:MAG: polyhydroxyalkanoic acid system family protein [Sphingomicrobium sp.]